MDPLTVSGLIAAGALVVCYVVRCHADQKQIEFIKAGAIFGATVEITFAVRLIPFFASQNVQHLAQGEGLGVVHLFFGAFALLWFLAFTIIQAFK